MLTVFLLTFLITFSSEDSAAQTQKCPDWPRTLYSQAVSICAACHEMWSNTFATFNADCNAECFRNDNFRKCLDQFTDRSKPVGINNP